MKNKILYLFIILSNFFLIAQERTNAELPQIENNQIGSLTTATGWMLNDDGQWISRKNRIPYKIENEFKKLIDIEIYSLGENKENFTTYELRNIKIKDSLYFILIKKFKNGDYKYSSIKKGWSYYNSLSYHVFEKNEFEKFKNLKLDTINNIELKVKYNKTFNYITNSFTLTDIAKDINKQIIKGRDYEPFLEESLVFNLNIQKDKVRFLITEGIEESRKKYQKAEDLIDYYYETELTNFNKLVKIN